MTIVRTLLAKNRTPKIRVSDRFSFAGFCPGSPLSLLCCKLTLSKVLFAHHLLSGSVRNFSERTRIRISRSTAETYFPLKLRLAACEPRNLGQPQICPFQNDLSYLNMIAKLCAPAQGGESLQTPLFHESYDLVAGLVKSHLRIGDT